MTIPQYDQYGYFSSTFGTTSGNDLSLQVTVDLCRVQDPFHVEAVLHGHLDWKWRHGHDFSESHLLNMYKELHFEKISGIYKWNEMIDCCVPTMYFIYQTSRIGKYSMSISQFFAGWSGNSCFPNMLRLRFLQLRLIPSLQASAFQELRNSCYLLSNYVVLPSRAYQELGVALLLCLPQIWTRRSMNLPQNYKTKWQHRQHHPDHWLPLVSQFLPNQS